MYYANYDENTGEILGFYVDGIHDDIPTPNIELTEEQWQQAISGEYRVIDGVLQEYSSTTELTTEQKIANLQDEYSKKLEDVRERYALAEIFENAEDISALKSEYNALLNDFRTFVGYIQAGNEIPHYTEVNSGSDGNTAKGYCPFCGNILTRGVCSNCKWTKI